MTRIPPTVIIDSIAPSGACKEREIEKMTTLRNVYMHQYRCQDKDCGKELASANLFLYGGDHYCPRCYQVQIDRTRNVLDFGYDIRRVGDYWNVTNEYGQYVVASPYFQHALRMADTRVTRIKDDLASVSPDKQVCPANRMRASK